MKLSIVASMEKNRQHETLALQHTRQKSVTRHVFFGAILLVLTL